MWKEKAFPFTAFPLMHLSIWYWLKCFWIKLNHCFCLWRASTLSGMAEKQLGMSWALNAFECSRSIRTFEKRSWTKNITMYDVVVCQSLLWIMQAMSSNVMHLQCIFFFALIPINRIEATHFRYPTCIRIFFLYLYPEENSHGPGSKSSRKIYVGF